MVKFHWGLSLIVGVWVSKADSWTASFKYWLKTFEVVMPLVFVTVIVAGVKSDRAGREFPPRNAHYWDADMAITASEVSKDHVGGKQPPPPQNSQAHGGLSPKTPPIGFSCSPTTVGSAVDILSRRW